MKPELLARWVLGLLVFGAIVFPLGASGLARFGLVEVHARMAEAGGFTPANITVAAGQPLHLRLVSDDVMHGFAVGQRNMPAIDLPAGRAVATTLTFDRPGKYVFYCTRWCGLGHWRMRGTIEVTGPETAVEEAVPPLYIQLGLNIDEPPGTPAHLPLHKPSAARGELLGVAPPAHYQAPDYLRAHSPAQVWQALRAEPATGSLDAEQVWDLVAFTLQSQTGPLAAALSRGDPPAQMEFGHRTVRPVAFTDSAHMLALSPARLQGKIIRGGMGTGMPYWGPIFTEAQTWALVDFLWSFQFQYKEMP